MSQYRQKEVEAIKASEEKEYRGKYALAKHETLALRCESLENQLAEARKNELKLLQEVEPVFSNFDSSPWRLEDDEPEIAQIWYNVLDRLKQLKEKGE